MAEKANPLKPRTRKRHEKNVSSFSGKEGKRKERKALTAQENPRPFRREWFQTVPRLLDLRKPAWANSSGQKQPRTENRF